MSQSGAFTSGSGASPVLVQKTWTLTSSQIKNLNASPVQLLPPPGSGKMYVLISSTGKLIYGGTTPFIAAASQTIDIYFGTSIQVITAISNSTIIATDTSYSETSAVSSLSVIATSVENTAWNLYNPQLTEISGDVANDSTMSGSIIYYITDI
jgi:hypothetical protein